MTLVPSIQVLQGQISLETNQQLMLAGTLCWFLSAPFWMNKKAADKIAYNTPKAFISSRQQHGN